MGTQTGVTKSNVLNPQNSQNSQKMKKFTEKLLRLLHALLYSFKEPTPSAPTLDSILDSFEWIMSYALDYQAIFQGEKLIEVFLCHLLHVSSNASYAQVCCPF